MAEVAPGVGQKHTDMGIIVRGEFRELTAESIGRLSQIYDSKLKSERAALGEVETKIQTLELGKEARHARQSPKKKGAEAKHGRTDL